MNTIKSKYDEMLKKLTEQVNENTNAIEQLKEQAALINKNYNKLLVRVQAIESWKDNYKPGDGSGSGGNNPDPGTPSDPIVNPDAITEIVNKVETINNNIENINSDISHLEESKLDVSVFNEYKDGLEEKINNEITSINETIGDLDSRVTDLEEAFEEHMQGYESDTNNINTQIRKLQATKLDITAFTAWKNQHDKEYEAYKEQQAAEFEAYKKAHDEEYAADKKGS